MILTKEYPLSLGNIVSINFPSNSTAPQSVQLIIEKLLCRYPEDRYQSYEGLILDLEKCLNAFEKTGSIPLFLPGIDDKPIDLKFEHYLYGRTVEVDYIKKSIESIKKTEQCRTINHSWPLRNWKNITCKACH